MEKSKNSPDYGTFISTQGSESTFGTIDKKHLDPKFVAHVNHLETRVKKLEKMVEQLYYPMRSRQG